MVLVVGGQAREHEVRPEAVHRQRRAPVGCEPRIEIRQRRGADHEHRIAVGEQRVRAVLAGELRVARPRVRAIEAQQAAANAHAPDVLDAPAPSVDDRSVPSPFVEEPTRTE